MGRYVTRIIEESEMKQLISLARTGWVDGSKHRPNHQIATILVLQANLGCRIGDIVGLTVESITWDGEGYKLDLIEQKTGKPRPFIVPSPVKGFIDGWIERNHIETGRIFTISEAAVWKWLRNATAYLGMENVSSHSFRKMASLRVYLDSGKDLALTSQFLNHSSGKTTLLYLKRSTKQMDSVLSHSVCIA